MDATTQLSLQFLEQRIGGLESLTTGMAAVESFAILRQLENVLFRVISNFKVNLFRGFKDFKRSELRAYQESHRGDLRALYQRPWITLSAVAIPTPRAMYRSYPMTATHLAELLQESRYKDALAHMSATLKTLTANAQATDDVGVKKALDGLYELWGTQGYAPNVLRLQPYIDLKDRGQVDRPARDMFSDPGDIANTAEVINGYEHYFTEIVVEKPALQALEQQLDQLVTKMEAAERIVPAYIKHFHDLIVAFSTFLDGYAKFLEAAQVVEHCFVLSLQTLMKAK